MTSHHSPAERDAGLRRLAALRRWLIAGSVAITGVFAAIAAHAFPGKTARPSGAQARSEGRPGDESAASASASAAQSSEGSAAPLNPPAQAPEGGEAASGERAEGAQQPAEGAQQS